MDNQSTQPRLQRHALMYTANPGDYRFFFWLPVATLLLGLVVGFGASALFARPVTSVTGVRQYAPVAPCMESHRAAAADARLIFIHQIGKARDKDATEPTAQPAATEDPKSPEGGVLAPEALQRAERDRSTAR